MRTAIWLHMLLVVVAVAGAGCATRSEAGPLEVEGELAGRILASGTAESPIELRPQEVTELSLELRNTSDRPVTVAHVRIEGELLDLIFLTYDTGVHQTIQPGDEGRMAFKIDFFDLQGQAHGLLRGQVRLYGENREPLGAVPVVLDGRGGRWATTVTFNLVLLGVATASFAWNLYRLSQRRLPGHRFARGLRFLHSGAAAGLTVSAASSTLRLWPLGTTGWVSITVVMTLFAFGLGYLSVGSDDDADDRAEDGPLGDPDGRPDGGGVIDLTAQEPVAVVPVAPPELPAPAVRLEGEPAAPGA